MITLAEIITALTQRRPEIPIVPITEASIDSRAINKDGMFVAIPGENADGHNFVAQAFQRGASVALIEHDVDGNFNKLDLRSGDVDLSRVTIATPIALLVPNSVIALQQIARRWRRQHNPRVIGITGSVGKSTTKEMIAQVLSQRYKTLRNLGNLNNEIGLPMTLINLNADHECAVLEMGFYVPGEIALLCDIAQPQVGVITNIGTVHAERSGSQEVIAQGKAELVQALPKDGVAILNYDDARVRGMADKTQARVLFYGLDDRAELRADLIAGLGLDGIKFRVCYQRDVIDLHLPLIGTHSVYTALRAIAVGLIEGLTWDEIENGLTQKQNPLRMKTARFKSGALIIDDTYNSAPESAVAALNLLGDLNGRKIAVLGDMLELGQYEAQGHETVGARAAQVADALITFGTRAHMIASAARKNGMNTLAIVEYEDVNEVIDWLKKNLSEKDNVLIKGSRGLRMDRIIAVLETAGE
jgi:UDP-N-acetylmuramoyl-tripeptide--D-alanyl-D-alanine ligase